MQTIGERLEDARKRKGLSIREAAEATKIRGDYLQKFEANQFNIGLTDIYIRGFLRNYSNFLQVPADRIVSDYNSLGHAEPRPRQPHREVYGRMEVSVSSSGGEPRAGRRGAAPAPEGEPGAPAEPSPAAGSGGEAARPSLRPLAPLPTSRVDPSTVFKALLLGGGVIGALLVFLLIYWLAKSLFFGGSPSKPADHAALLNQPPPAAVQEADTPVTLSAVDTTTLRVTGETDGHEIWSGQLAAGERHDFPNIGLKLDAAPIENLRLEYGGYKAQFGARGHRVAVIPVMTNSGGAGRPAGQ